MRQSAENDLVNRDHAAAAIWFANAMIKTYNDADFGCLRECHQYNSIIIQPLLTIHLRCSSHQGQLALIVWIYSYWIFMAMYLMSHLSLLLSALLRLKHVTHERISLQIKSIIIFCSKIMRHISFGNKNKCRRNSPLLCYISDDVSFL